MKLILKNLREQSGLSQKDVANKLGYQTPQFISNWERGVSLPPFSAIKALARMYNSDRKFLATNLKDAHISKFTKKLEREIKSI